MVMKELLILAEFSNRRAAPKLMGVPLYHYCVYCHYFHDGQPDVSSYYFNTNIIIGALQRCKQFQLVAISHDFLISDANRNLSCSWSGLSITIICYCSCVYERNINPLGAEIVRTITHHSLYRTWM